MSLLSSSFRHIIRIIGTDIDGNKRLDMGLTDIPGVDIRLAHAILHVANMDQTSRVGFLSDRDVKKLEVSPRLIPKNHPLNVDGTLNAIMLDSDVANDITIIGRGAGAKETASALFSDVLGIAREI